jgi:hypothetical protein
MPSSAGGHDRQLPTRHRQAQARPRIASDWLMTDLTRGCGDSLALPLIANPRPAGHPLAEHVVDFAADPPDRGHHNYLVRRQRHHRRDAEAAPPSRTP